MITVTQKAVDHIKRLMDKHLPGAAGLRAIVKGGGCNGFSYDFEFISSDNISFDDEVVEVDGVRVFIDPISVLYLVGSQLDYEDTIMMQRLVFNNPNVKSSCGCGESFSV